MAISSSEEVNLESSEPEEKRQLLNFLLQNLKLDGKKLSFKLKTPFNTVPQTSKCSNLLAWRNSFRTFEWSKALPAPEVVISQVKQLLALV